MIPFVIGAIVGTALTSILLEAARGMVQINGESIKTNLAKVGELKELAEKLTKDCKGIDALEIQKLFDFVTKIPYRSDNTSRHALEVVESNWGDCDDKCNLFASLLQERGYDYKLVDVNEHVFLVVRVKNQKYIKSHNAAHLIINGKEYYYAETTARGAKIGEYNGYPLSEFIGIHDIKQNQSIDLNQVVLKRGKRSIPTTHPVALVR